MINRASKPNLQSCGMKTPVAPTRYDLKGKSTGYVMKEQNGKQGRVVDMIEKTTDGSLVQRRVLDDQSSCIAPSVT